MKEHITIRNQKLFCLNCGGEWGLNYPLPLKEMQEKIEAFNTLHNHCKKIWQEPVVNMNNKINDRMMFWLANGERGISSETIFEKLSGMNLNITYRSHPLDPDDFNRCHKLLLAIPEWKDRIIELKELSPIWSNLVDNWDKLTEMLKDLIEKRKDNGMYDFMKSIGC